MNQLIADLHKTASYCDIVFAPGVKRRLQPFGVIHVVSFRGLGNRSPYQDCKHDGRDNNGCNVCISRDREFHALHFYQSLGRNSK